MDVIRPNMVMRLITPVVLANDLGIYILVTAVIINGKLDPQSSAFFWFKGVMSVIVFTNRGTAFSTAQSCAGSSSMEVIRPDMAMRLLASVFVANVFGIQITKQPIEPPRPP